MARETQLVTDKGTSIELSTDLSAETLQTRKMWHDIFEVLIRKNLLIAL